MTLEELVLDTTDGKTGALRSIVRPLPLVGPGAGPESVGSKLVFLGELTSDDGRAGTVLDILLEVFEHGCTPAKNQQPPSPVALFEKGVGSVNQALSTLAAEGHVGWVGSLHVVLALVSETELHLTRSGDARGFLLRGSQFIDILRGQTSSSENPLKTFGTIISGRLEPGDRALLSTPQLFDFLSNEKIRRVLTERSPDMAKMELESLLAPDGSPDGSVGLFVFERAGEVSAPVTAPSVLRNRSRQSSSVSAISPDVHTSAPEGRRGQTAVKSPVIAPEAPVVEQAPSPGAMFRTVTKGMSGVATRGASVLKTLRARNTKQSVASGATVVPQPSLSSASKQFAPNILHQAKRFVTRLRRLPRISQGLLGGAILLILVLVVSVSVNTSRQETAQTTASNSELVTSVQQDIKKASDTLLFRDEATALALLSGAEARLETEVIPSGAASEEELTLLQASLADVYDQIDKITRLDGLTPALAIDNASPRGLIESGDERLFYTATDVYGFTDSGAIRLRATQPDGTSEQFVGAFQDADGGKTVLLGSAGSLFTFNPDTDALGLVDGSVPDGADLQGGAQYNNNLYVLNRTDDQILKFRPAGSGFATGTSWIADGGVSLASATDLAIDGDIYVLFQNGTIEKYLSGSRQEFTLGTPSKPYTSATHLATSSNANRLVLLDPSTLRLGVFDKATGELTAQYEADVFAGALDLFLNDSGSQATVLTSDGIYEVGL